MIRSTYIQELDVRSCTQKQETPGFFTQL